MKRVIAIASGGGHWVQLYRLRPAWDGCHLTYITTRPGFEDMVAKDAEARGQRVPEIILVPEANRWQKARLAALLARLTWITLRLRPHLIVTTGAAPGYLALRLGRFVGAQTVWIDSIANASELSLSGRLARKHADHCLTQWPEVAAREGVAYEGAIL